MQFLSLPIISMISLLADLDSDQCAHNLRVIIDVVHHLGMPHAMDKLIGPVTLIIYLGIEIDSVAQEIRLPKDKLDDLNSCL